MRQFQIERIVHRRAVFDHDNAVAQFRHRLFQFGPGAVDMEHLRTVMRRHDGIGRVAHHGELVIGLSTLQRALKVGERVYTIGSPRGLQRSLGEGLVAGLRNREGLRLIQTGAAAAPGSSGGGLFDAAGNLVGITTFAIGGEQVNFAIAAAD